MNIEKIIKLRYLFTIIFGSIFFVGTQVIPATSTQETWTFFEAIMGIFLLPLPQIFLFSEYLYSKLKDDGFKISYKTYQFMGLVTAIGTFILLFNVYVLR